MHPEMEYKFCIFGENRARDMPLRGVYVLHFDLISVKISVLGVLYPYRCTDGGEIWHGDKVPSSMPNFMPIGATCRPCVAKNLKIGLRVA